MKQSCLVTALLMTAVVILASSCAKPVDGSAVPDSAAEPVAAHIEAIENDIRPIGPVAEAQTKQTLAERMRFYKVPAVSIALINNYQIEWARAWGVIEPGGRQSATPDTLFQAGSISKSVGAMAAMRLVQERKLQLDGNVNDQLTSWKVPENELTRTKPVTLLELLTHSAGTTVHGFPGYTVSVQRPTLTEVLDGLPPANTPAVRVEDVPGSKWKYSGGGYEIIQQLMTDVSGERFPELMQRTVLGPLGMKHSTYEQPLPLALETDAAAGTFADGAGVPGKWHVYPEMMAAGLWTTASDLARFTVALMNAARGDSNPVISAPTAKLMLTPRIETKTPGLPEKDALGVFIEGRGDEVRFSHMGANTGFQAALLGYSAGYGLVIMTNSDHGLELAGEIIRAVEREYRWPQSSPW